MGPRGWTSQQVWDWSSPSLNQKPAVSVQDLALWVTAAANPQSNMQGRLGSGWLSVLRDFIEHRRVFCDMGSPADVGVLLFPRWLLVLIASGIPLVVGVILTVLPRLITVVLVVASAFFIGGMAIGPTVTLCVLKASLPGLALAVPAGVTSWWRRLPKSRAQGTYEPESWEMKQLGSRKSHLKSHSLSI